MALLHFDALQDPITMPLKNDTSTIYPWKAGTSWAAAVTGRDGQPNGAAQGSAGGRILMLGGGSSPSVTAFACKAASGAIGNTGAHLLDVCSADTPVVEVIFRINASGFIEARRLVTTGTLLAVSSGHSPITANTWNHYQIHCDLINHADPRYGITVRLNDVQVMNQRNIQTSTTTGGSNPAIRFISPTGTSSLTWDDLYLTNGTDATYYQGRPNIDFLGDLYALVLRPSGPGDFTGWTSSTGAANWDTVNDSPHSTSNYVSANASSLGTKDLYQVENLPTNVGALYGYRIVTVAMKSDSGTALFGPIYKNKVVSEVTGGNTPLTTTPEIYRSQFAYAADGEPQPILITADYINSFQTGVGVGFTG